VFFKAGVLAHLEEMRDDALSIIITKFQCACRHYTAQAEYKRRLQQLFVRVNLVTDYLFV
jgi:myosin heavy subunit